MKDILKVFLFLLMAIVIYSPEKVKASVAEDYGIEYDTDTYSGSWYETKHVAIKASVGTGIFNGNIKVGDVLGTVDVCAGLLTSKNKIINSAGESVKYQQIVYCVKMNPSTIKGVYKGTSQYLKVGINGHCWYSKGGKTVDLMLGQYMEPIFDSNTDVEKGKELTYSFSVEGSLGKTTSVDATGKITSKSGEIKIGADVAVKSTVSYKQGMLTFGHNFDDNGSNFWWYDYNEEDSYADRMAYLLCSSSQVGKLVWHMPEEITKQDQYGYYYTADCDLVVTGLTLSVFPTFGVANSSTYINIKGKSSIESGETTYNIGRQSVGLTLYFK